MPLKKIGQLAQLTLPGGLVVPRRWVSCATYILLQNKCVIQSKICTNFVLLTTVITSVETCQFVRNITYK